MSKKIIAIFLCDETQLCMPVVTKEFLYITQSDTTKSDFPNNLVFCQMSGNIG